MVNNSIPAVNLVAFAEGHFKSESSSVSNALSLLKDNKVDWLTAQSLLDNSRRNVLAVSSVIQTLLADHPNEYQKVETAFSSVMQQIDTTNETMISNYLLNGPKAVAA